MLATTMLGLLAYLLPLTGKRILETCVLCRYEPFCFIALFLPCIALNRKAFVLTLFYVSLTFKLAVQALTQLICYFPNTADQSTIACVIPLQGDACALEKKYQKMLTGASSVLVILAFMLVPRTLELLFSIMFGVCCEKAFVRARGKTVKGVSLSLAIIAALGVLVLLLALNGGTGFLGLRITVWVVTWLGSMIIMEPIVCLITYYIIRCKKPDEMDASDIEEPHNEHKPLLAADKELSSSHLNTGLSGHTGMAAAPHTIDPSSALSDMEESLPPEDSTLHQ